MSNAQASPAGREDRAERRYVLGSHPIDVGKLAPGLHIVATPIGNLGDVTLRALATLAGADLIACEDTRVTRKLLDRYAITTPRTPYHDHNAATARPKLLRRLAEGAAIALVSDAANLYAILAPAATAGESSAACIDGVGDVLRHLAGRDQHDVEADVALNVVGVVSEPQLRRGDDAARHCSFPGSAPLPAQARAGRGSGAAARSPAPLRLPHL